MEVKTEFCILGLCCDHFNLVPVGFDSIFKGSWTRQHYDKILMFKLSRPLFCLDSLCDGFDGCDRWHEDLLPIQSSCPSCDHSSSFAKQRCFGENKCLCDCSWFAFRYQFCFYLHGKPFGTVWQLSTQDGITHCWKLVNWIMWLNPANFQTLFLLLQIQNRHGNHILHAGLENFFLRVPDTSGVLSYDVYAWLWSQWVQKGQ